MILIRDSLLFILSVVQFMIFAHVIFSWLVSFNVLSLQNPNIRNIWDSLQQITEPIYGPIRRMLPRTGGLDLSPLVALFGVFFLTRAIQLYFPVG